MRLFFRAAAIDAASFLNQCRQYGVGVVRSETVLVPKLDENGNQIPTRVEKVDVRGEVVNGDDGKPIMLDSVVMERRRRISFDFLAGETPENVEKVREICLVSGLVSEGASDEVVCRTTEPVLQPKAR